LPATILNFPHRLTWERCANGFLADAFDPAGRYAGCYLVEAPPLGTIHWNVIYRGPHQGAAVAPCGFATAPEAAQAIADDHWRKLSIA
jgi:hypothetical protein